MQTCFSKAAQKGLGRGWVTRVPELSSSSSLIGVVNQTRNRSSNFRLKIKSRSEVTGGGGLQGCLNCRPVHL